MQKRIVHGTPITPAHLLEELAGGSFCVSFADPRQADRCVELVGEDQILILDNGAFSIWCAEKRGSELPARLQFATADEYRTAFWSWANAIQARCPNAVAVIPDVIEGSEHDNLLELSHALREGMAQFPERTMAIWHMDDSLEQLQTMARVCNFVGIGSCRDFDVQRNRRGYLARLREASAHLDYVEQFHGRRPWVHLMRGLGVFAKACRFESADSTNVARNHNRTRGQFQHVRRMARRIQSEIQAHADQAPVGQDAVTSNFDPAFETDDQVAAPAAA